MSPPAKAKRQLSSARRHSVQTASCTVNSHSRQGHRVAHDGAGEGIGDGGPKQPKHFVIGGLMRPVQGSCGRNSRIAAVVGDDDDAVTARCGDYDCAGVVAEGDRHRTTTRYHTMSRVVGDGLYVIGKSPTAMRERSPCCYIPWEQEGKV